MNHREIEAIADTDPLDSRMGLGSRFRPSLRSSWWLRSRLALGLSPTPLPGLVLLIGLAAGPEGLGVFSSQVLTYLDPVVAVALAALGILIGLGLDLRRPREARLLGAATLEAGLTLMLVTAGVLFVGSGQFPSGLSPWLVALIFGICASASATVPGMNSSPAGTIATRMGDLDDVLPILLSGLAIALIREASAGWAVSLAAQAIGIALAVALAGWLLVSQAASDSEQRVFTVGTVVLLGGITEFLGTSALLAGLAAGIIWNKAGGTARDRFARDVRHMQHPLLVLLLLIAGARLGFPPALGALVLTYVVLRVIGKLVGGWLAARLIGPGPPAQLGLYLISPGIIAVAVALNAEQAAGDAAGDAAALILAVAVVGSIASELLAFLVHPPTGGHR